MSVSARRGPADADWPYYALNEDVDGEILRELQAGRAVALATLVAKEGSTPRPLGARMAIFEDGTVSGSVSGGCVEGSLAIAGAEVLAGGDAQHLAFGEGSPFVDVRLPCGSRIEVAVEALRPDSKAAGTLMKCLSTRRPVQWYGSLAGGASTCEEGLALPNAGLEPDGRRYFVRFTPRVRLVVSGADAVALALVLYAPVIGFETVHWRPLGPSAPPEGFAGRYLNGSFHELRATVTPDPWTAVVAASHDLDTDHDVIAWALPSKAAYVGVLGSRKHLEARRARLEAGGFSEREIARLNAPVGLDIGSTTPSEIALSVLADLVRLKNRA